MKIAIVGTGYVGLSLATLLSERHEVVALDIVPEKVSQINLRKSPIKDEYIEKYFSEKDLNLKATLNSHEAFSDANFIIISTPTNYDPEQNYFDTSSVESVLEEVHSMYGTEYVGDRPTIVIKSTIPVGFTKQMREKYPEFEIFFSPEFLREGKALYDNLYPSRIIVGSRKESGQKFANLLQEAALSKDVPVLLMDSTEAEAVKLFANTYLALRVSYFNELDTYADIKGLNTKDIINGVCLDPRIGNYYNNPSFGYGGYCLPKDTKQLLANYENVPQNLIEAIVKANETRKQFIVDEVEKIMEDVSCQSQSQNPGTIGIYRLTMKSGSDNFRSSAILDIILKLHAAGKQVIIYEPTITSDTFENIPVIHNLTEFKEKSTIILANRIEEDIADIKEKIYTRDLWSRD